MMKNNLNLPFPIPKKFLILIPAILFLFFGGQGYFQLILIIILIIGWILIIKYRLWDRCDV